MRLFTRAFPIRSFASPRSLYKEAFLAFSFRSIVRALVHYDLSRSLASLCSALLCYARASAHLASLLFSASPSASSLLVPRLSSLSVSTTLFSLLNIHLMHGVRKPEQESNCSLKVLGRNLQWVCSTNVLAKKINEERNML